jgi:hypothetical protein
MSPRVAGLWNTCGMEDDVRDCDLHSGENVIQNEMETHLLREHIGIDPEAYNYLR